MLMYEPGHEKYNEKRNSEVITATSQSKIPLSSIFGNRTMSYFKQSSNSR